MLVILLTMSNKYGPFDGLVDLATSAVAAAGALCTLVVGRRRRWNPMSGGALDWLSVLPVAVGLLLLGVAPAVVRATVAIVGLVVAIGCGIKYAGKLDSYRYRMETSPDRKGKFKRTYVVKGNEYTPQAVKKLESEQLDDVVKDCGYKVERVDAGVDRETRTACSAGFCQR